MSRTWFDKFWTHEDICPRLKYLLDDFDAVELVKISSEIMGGKGGGGRKDMALAGAKDASKSARVFEELIKKLKENI